MQVQTQYDQETFKRDRKCEPSCNKNQAVYYNSGYDDDESENLNQKYLLCTHSSQILLKFIKYLENLQHMIHGRFLN